MDSSDWSNGIRCHIFDTRPDTEFNSINTRVESAHGSSVLSFNIHKLISTFAYYFTRDAR